MPKFSRSCNCTIHFKHDISDSASYHLLWMPILVSLYIRKALLSYINVLLPPQWSFLLLLVSIEPITQRCLKLAWCFPNNTFTSRPTWMSKEPLKTTKYFLTLASNNFAGIFLHFFANRNNTLGLFHFHSSSTKYSYANNCKYVPLFYQTHGFLSANK